eukprot:9493385-Pyramimonas_sp.AAC.1
MIICKAKIKAYMCCTDYLVFQKLLIRFRRGFEVQTCHWSYNPNGPLTPSRSCAIYFGYRCKDWWRPPYPLRAP